jgi:hypothetical protein
LLKNTSIIVLCEFNSSGRHKPRIWIVGQFELQCRAYISNANESPVQNVGPQEKAIGICVPNGAGRGLFTAG